MNAINIMIILTLLLIGIIWLLVIVHGKKVRRYRKLLMTDSLTGSLSYAGFLKEAAKYLDANGKQYVFVAMQLRNYPQLLKAFGSKKADSVLVRLQQVLAMILSASEPAGRTDSSTFCFLMKNRQTDAIRARLTRIYEAASRIDPESQIPLDLKFGIYIPGEKQESAEVILKITNALLTDSKSDQLYQFFQASPENAPARKQERITQIEHALKNGEFTVYMQPKVRISDNRIVGAEALIRWRHPRQGMLTPDMFIPLMDEYHLTPKLDRYLFEQVCQQMSQWIRQDWTPVPVSVNLSYETIQTPSFAAGYDQVCKKYGISPELIEFELPDVILQKLSPEIVPVIDQIHSYKFRCALDNLGKYVIPLSLLRDLNVDTIKLDAKLLSIENNNRRNRFVVEAILKLATQMQIHTVAEGIDNASQVQYLKQAGCDMIQGYYYFQPMPIKEFSVRAFHKGQPGYAEGSGAQNANAFRSDDRNASNKITMFSLQTDTDHIQFSNLFSPALEGKYTFTNATSLFRYSALIHENDQKDFFRLLERCEKENGWVENAIRFYTGKDHYEWLEVHMHREPGVAGEGAVISGTLVNMSGLKNEVNRWKEKANRDALTGLYNREYFEKTASAALEKGALASGAIIFVDIDDFKNVNDTLGHVIGDDVICSIAKRLLGTFRHTDVVARYGGDEFVVLVNGIGEEDLTKRLQQLCDSFRFPYRNGSIEYPVSTSIGAAMFPKDGNSYLQVLDHADSALYVAKRQGKNRFVLFHPDYEGLSE